MEQLQNRVAVVTGGGSGLGRELALCCARRGMTVVLGDVDEPGMEETRRLIAAESPDVDCAAYPLDVSSLQAVTAFAEEVFARFGAVHVLFNNAGVAVNGPLWEHTEADWQWVLGVNLNGVAWGIKAFVPRMLAQGEGHVVNTASAAGWVNAPGSGIYNASKCAVVAMSETLALDLRDVDASIGVTVVSPAFFPTPIADSERNRPAALADTAPMSEARRRRSDELRYAVEHGRIPADTIAEMTLAAVEADQFYVFPHRGIKALVRARADAAHRETAVFDTLAGK
ncbi:SDR family NAD(P)-dependent oxidoreductase [Aquisalimonas asiatica]|uniref:NADP-dependent 3-hydroxy acid dehydrogenase YdfG n=1 Tax=Aquisalimonas asiatica TaxID=406100 RepID=A0A1H8Q4H4_9GAMM|nr:SDR family NAD(P)-dependent oxidoreductase [Aquisalimonas asiatica]SEO48966.1 NADP-dependent 3-hydroxy acid dehydrogenase YdfG [Aquisalimonas asiatica]